MISEKIMHECILKLIRTNKPESMEDHLECLCKLLTTIGKDLDHHDAKVSLYSFQFSVFINLAIHNYFIDKILISIFLSFF